MLNIEIFHGYRRLYIYICIYILQLTEHHVSGSEKTKMTRMKIMVIGPLYFFLDIQYPLNLLVALIISISLLSFKESLGPCIETLSRVQI